MHSRAPSVVCSAYSASKARRIPRSSTARSCRAWDTEGTEPTVASEPAGWTGPARFHQTAPDFLRDSSGLRHGDRAASAMKPSAQTDGGSGTRVDLLEGLARITEGVDAGGNAAINGDLEQDLLDLLLGQSVLQSAFHVQLQFVRPVQRAEHGQIDDRARAPVDPGPG